MGMMGQSSNKSEPDYHPLGLPLVRSHVRIVQPVRVSVVVCYIARLVCRALACCHMFAPQEDVCLSRCGTWTDNVTGFEPGPLYRLGFSAINRTSGARVMWPQRVHRALTRVLCSVQLRSELARIPRRRLAAR
jgi:hypothetical protein